MATTPHLGLTLVEPAQAQKEVTVNMALMQVDALLNTAVMDKDLTAPPGAPTEGDVYIVGATATGDWAEQEKALTYFEQVWRFIAPNEGLTVWVADEDTHYTFDGTNWVDVGGANLGAALTSIAGLTTAADNMIYTTASDSYAVTGLTGFGRSLIDDADASTARGTLGFINSGTSDNALVRFDGTSGATQNSGVTVSDTNELAGFRAAINLQTGTAYEIASTDAGKVVECSNASAITVTLPNDLPAGFACTVVQSGAGQVTFSAEAGGTLNHRQSHTKIAGQNDFTTFYVSSNAGTNAKWMLAGDTE